MIAFCHIGGVMKKDFKKLSLLLMIVLLVMFGLLQQASAADYYIYDGSYNTKENGKNKTVFVYHSRNEYVYVYDSKPAWGPVYVTKKTAPIKYSVGNSVTYAYESTWGFSGKLGLEINSGIVKKSYEIAGGLSGTNKHTISTNSATSGTIDKSMNEGYYIFTACVNYKKVKIRKWTSGKGGKLEKEYYYYMPTGQKYEALCFSSTSRSGSYKKVK